MCARPTLDELALAVGLNEKRLNAGFRALFGATVFEVLRNERLDHARIAIAEGARLQERIGEEEIPHVAFALHWFERWTGTTELGAWADALPAPLSPLVMRGDPLNRADRRRAGMTDGFLDELERWTARAPGS